MLKPKNFPTLPRTNYEFQKGESIETKVARIVANNEPITDGAPIIYTNREDGVLPGYNIRTDRWDIAQEAMTAIAQQNIAKAKTYGVKPKDTEQNVPAPESKSQQQSAEG